MDFTFPLFGAVSVTGAIVGMRSAWRLTAVRWGVTKQIDWAWVVTIPAIVYEIFA